MTVAEVIEELQHFPPYYVVAIAVDAESYSGLPATDEHYIADVTEGAHGEVRID